MYRGTTPTIMWKIKSDVDLDSIVNGQMVFNNAGILLIKQFEDLIIDAENKTISTELTQEDTLSFIGGEVEVQVRVRFDTNITMATQVRKTTAERILHGEVI